MNSTPLPFLNRTAELERLRTLTEAGKSVLLHGPAGIGKTALLAEWRRQGSKRAALVTAATAEPARWLRAAAQALMCEHHHARLCERLRLPPEPTPAEVRASLGRKSAGALRTYLTEALGEGGYVLVLDPLAFLSQAFYELLRDLARTTGTPLVLAARSDHMEDIGYAAKFAWPREQRLNLNPLPGADAAALFDRAVRAWARPPANHDAFRAHVLDYANGNPGTLLGLVALAEDRAYWAGDGVKLHLLTVDFNLRGHSAAGSRR